MSMQLSSLPGKKRRQARPITTRLRDAYWEAHDDPKYQTAVNYK
jgi:hypothetical protein